MKQSHTLDATGHNSVSSAVCDSQFLSLRTNIIRPTLVCSWLALLWTCLCFWNSGVSIWPTWQMSSLQVIVPKQVPRPIARKPCCYRHCFGTIIHTVSIMVVVDIYRVFWVLLPSCLPLLFEDTFESPLLTCACYRHRDGCIRSKAETVFIEIICLYQGQYTFTHWYLPHGRAYIPAMFKHLLHLVVALWQSAMTDAWSWPKDSLRRIPILYIPCNCSDLDCSQIQFALPRHSSWCHIAVPEGMVGWRQIMEPDV